MQDQLFKEMIPKQMTEKKNIQDVGGGMYIVTSFSDPSIKYHVNLNENTCTCPYFVIRKIECKHISSLKKGRVPKKPNISFSLTQSLLQKAVRQNRGDVAVKSAKEMIKQNVQKFIRRLLVIMIEDCIAHPKMGKVGDLYSASQRKDFQLTEEDKDFLINVVYQIAECKQLDLFPEREIRIANPEKNEAYEQRETYQNKLYTLPDEEQHFLKAIWLRSITGGMLGDVAMLKNYYYLWLKRFVDGEWVLDDLNKYFEESYFTYAEVDKLQAVDIILESADFHCTPMLKVLLRKEYIRKLIDENFKDAITEQDKQDRLGALLWRQHSWTNHKIELDTGRVRDWYEKEEGKFANKEIETMIYNRIKGDVYGFAIWWLKTTTNLK